MRVVALRRSAIARGILVVGVLLGGAALVRAITTDLTLVRALHEPFDEHVDQTELIDLVKAGNIAGAFTEAFEQGDEFFETEFTALDGIGANVGDGSRFTRIPRADLAGAGQWARHVPSRATGPNATSCNSCHIQLFDDGSGSAVGNVHRDPLHSGTLARFIQRNTPHVFALGALQRLAEEMTTELLQQKAAATQQACLFGAGSASLAAKGTSFGSIRATRTRATPCAVVYDTSRVTGVGTDLVVRPFQWKGSVASVREFNRDAAHNELGMQPVEFGGDGIDGDGDGVVDEVTVGDVTALTVYLASQPRPTTTQELASVGLIEPLDPLMTAAIDRGRTVFAAIGCASCHTPRMVLNDPVFSEPSRMAQYRDATFPAGQNPVAAGVDPKFPITVDLTRDQPDNRITDGNGTIVYRLGSLARDSRGRAVVDLYSDLKRHDMGTRLAESIDEVGTGRATFLTRTLWGIGSTAPYLHDGRATTLTEAILEHGGEAVAARNNFAARPLTDQKAVLAFLDSLVLFKMSEDQVTIPPPATTTLAPSLSIQRTGGARLSR